MSSRILTSLGSSFNNKNSSLSSFVRLFQSRNYRSSPPPLPAVFINKNTRAICQGIFEDYGTLRTVLDMHYGTNMVGGVAPTRGGTVHLGLPIFNSIEEAKTVTNANATVIYGPSHLTAPSVMEAIEAELDLVVCVSEGNPDDMVKVKEALLRQSKTCLIGPGASGIIKPKECRIGLMPGYYHVPGRIGIVFSTTAVGLGQSCCIGIGKDPFIGTNFVDCVRKFIADPLTEGIVLIGGIGGSAEEESAAFIKESGTEKPVIAVIAGLTSPPGRRMAQPRVVPGEKGTAQDKCKTLMAAGVIVVDSPAKVGEAFMECYTQRGFFVKYGKLAGRRLNWPVRCPFEELYHEEPPDGHYSGCSDASIRSSSTDEKVDVYKIGNYIRGGNGKYGVASHCDLTEVAVNQLKCRGIEMSINQLEAHAAKEAIDLAVEKKKLPLTLAIDNQTVGKLASGIAESKTSHAIFKELRRLVVSHGIKVDISSRVSNKIADLIADMELQGRNVFDTFQDIPKELQMKLKELLEYEQLGLPIRKFETKKRTIERFF
ncbi:hypothetical protein C5167_028290 [Papaver somniferum]|nr:hypothetical protein C5167_028290 [Papaver somniferum]